MAYRFHSFKQCVAGGVCLLALFAGSTFARVDASVAERLLEKSGTLTQSDAVPAQFKANFEQGLREQKDATLTREEITRLVTQVDRIMAAADLRRSIIAAVADRLSADDVKALDAWYESDAGKKMLRFEAAAAKSDSVVALREGAAIARMLAEARVALLRELIEATRAGDFVAELSIDMSVGATHAVLSATSRTAPPSVSTLRESAERERPQIVQSVSDALLAAYAKTYESASDAELIAYRDFMLSSAGKSLSSAVIAAFTRALTFRSNEISRTLSSQNTPQRR